MAHELAHVAQQQDRSATPHRKVAVGAANTPAEQHADRVAAHVTAGAAPARMLVDQGALAAGQMTKKEFLAQLRGQVVAAVEAGLGRLGATADCPYIERYFAKYAGEPAAATESLIRHWVPAARNAKTASGLVPMILARVREGVRTWQSSGQLPADLVAAEIQMCSVACSRSTARERSLSGPAKRSKMRSRGSTRMASTA